MTHHVSTNRMGRLLGLVVMAALVAGCAAGRALGRAEAAARAGDWDAAVEQYRQAVQAEPDRVDYQIALERAMRNASILHLDQARVLEARGQLEDALREYRRASEYDPANRQLAAKALEIERRIRDEVEAARPRASIQRLQEAARVTAPGPSAGRRSTSTPSRVVSRRPTSTCRYRRLSCAFWRATRKAG